MKFYRNTQAELNTNLSRHFKLKEFRCKCGQCRLTWVDPELNMRLEVLRRLVKKPLYILSGYRCQEHNRNTVGSAEYSYHMTGQAVDLKPPKEDLEGFVANCKMLFNFVIVTGAYIHVDVGQR